MDLLLKNLGDSPFNWAVLAERNADYDAPQKRFLVLTVHKTLACVAALIPPRKKKEKSNSQNKNRGLRQRFDLFEVGFPQ